ncbi:MAG: hypothetical protein KOO60_12205 [Gemmatimonadales bacterium]|nr:hypothetical protein [Gemmatimonadales bacterium]
MNNRLLLSVLLISSLLFAPSALLAESYLSGTISAESSGGNELGAWKYTLHVVWDTGTLFGLSHVDLIIDDGTHCECDELGDAIAWDTPAGYLMGEEGDCQMGLDKELNCMGDPSIGVLSPLFKFEPNEGPDCHAGPVGELTIIFFSDYSPAPIADPNLFLVDKYSQYSEFGMVTGFFPGLPCDPVSSKTLHWGGLKAVYR